MGTTLEMTVSRYQPMVIVTDRRVECLCGQLAIVMLYSEDGDTVAIANYCQECWAQQEVTEE